MKKFTGNKNVVLKRALIIAGSVVGIVLTAGLIAKNKAALSEVVDR